MTIPVMKMHMMLTAVSSKLMAAKVEASAAMKQLYEGLYSLPRNGGHTSLLVDITEEFVCEQS